MIKFFIKQQNKFTLIFFLVLIFSFLFFPKGFVLAEEKISNFDLNAQINSDASVSITETIEYDFGDQYKHGIFRTIPLGFIARGEPEHTKINVTGVADEFGNKYQYSLTSNDPVNIKIGDPSNTITGKHTYKIFYLLEKSIGYFDNYDEWYWNLTGNDWEIPIENVTATVVLPQKVNESEFKLKDYCGYEGSIQSCGTFSIKDGQTIFYTTNQNYELGSSQGATIAVGFPKGLVVAPSKLDVFWAWFLRVWFLPFPFLLVFLWFRKRFAYLLKRRKYYQSNPIISEYDAGGFNPLEVGLLVNGFNKNKNISAMIVSLAIAGYIKIEEKDGEFCFKKIKEASSSFTASEKNIFEAIDGVCESNFGKKEAIKFSDALIKTSSNLIARDYMTSIGKPKNNNFPSGVSSVMKVILPLFLAVNPGLFFWIVGGIFFGSIWAGYIFSGTCVLIAILNIFLKNRTVYLTEKGFEAERKLLGLKLYINIAEKDRINFANAPAKTPELFEKLLPYAMIFGLEKKWAKEFEGIYQTNPEWYAGSSTNAFSTILFINNIHSVQSFANQAIVSSVKSSFHSSWSSSSGGSSGGGSSGGGGGGGGGGSW